MTDTVRVSDGVRFEVVGADDVLAVGVDGMSAEDVAALAAGAAQTALAGRVVFVGAGGDWSVRPAAQTPPAAAADLLPWEAFAPALRDELKDLATRYGAVNVHHAAVRLGELMAEHGAGGAAVRRAVTRSRRAGRQ